MLLNEQASSAVAASTPPSTIVTSPSGNASATISAITFDDGAASSDGLTMIALPAASAPSTGRKPITYGAFQLGSTSTMPLARSEEHTSELQSLMRISYAVFCLKKKKSDRLIK